MVFLVDKMVVIDILSSVFKVLFLFLDKVFVLMEIWFMNIFEMMFSSILVFCGVFLFLMIEVSFFIIGFLRFF